MKLIIENKQEGLKLIIENKQGGFSMWECHDPGGKSIASKSKLICNLSLWPCTEPTAISLSQW